MRQVVFIAQSQKDLRGLPKDAQRDIGFALHKAQIGELPHDAKPLHGFGSGVFEIVADNRHGAFRAAYVIRLRKAVYVLHVFQKKSKSGIATPKPDLNLIAERLKRAEELDKND